MNIKTLNNHTHTPAIPFRFLSFYLLYLSASPCKLFFFIYSNRTLHSWLVFIFHFASVLLLFYIHRSVILSLFLACARALGFRVARCMWVSQYVVYIQWLRRMFYRGVFATHSLRTVQLELRLLYMYLLPFSWFRNIELSWREEYSLLKQVLKKKKKNYQLHTFCSHQQEYDT